MTKEERIKSILSELEYGYIGYDNIHGDNEHGGGVIKEALEKQIPKKRLVVEITEGLDKGLHWYYCPVCYGKGKTNNKYNVKNYCDDCGQRLED